MRPVAISAAAERSLVFVQILAWLRFLSLLHCPDETWGWRELLGL